LIASLNDRFGKQKEEKAPNLLRIIAHANDITHWITTCILKYSLSKLRADALAYFIHVLSV
jgi:hypothetical protein